MARILVDMDGICADIHKAWYKWLADEHGFSMTEAQQHDFDMAKCVPEEIGVKVFDCLQLPGFFRALEPIPGSLEAIEHLHANGHHVLIVTAAEAAVSHMEKKQWVQEHLPFLNKRQFITAHEKWLIQADALVDDSPRNARDFRAAQPKSLICTLTYPYNEKCEAYSLHALPRRERAEAWGSIRWFLERELPV